MPLVVHEPQVVKAGLLPKQALEPLDAALERRDPIVGTGDASQFPDAPQERPQNLLFDRMPE
jgi:hypothetical protein